VSESLCLDYRQTGHYSCLEGFCPDRRPTGSSAIQLLRYEARMGSHNLPFPLL